ncbi:hypothetical protein [Streptomyces hydrogenans]|uniref:hypothetical protein n=1 Tax=Streptomyces hydrogenans TaxID=1873719 RepID=UPI0036C04EFA
MATADAACLHEHDVVGVRYAADHAHQQKALAENAAAMAEVRKVLEFKVRAAKSRSRTSDREFKRTGARARSTSPRPAGASR